MKKLLSLVLTIAMLSTMLVAFAIPASAAGTIDDPAAVTFTAVDTSNTVTVPANGEYYVELTLPQNYVGYMLTISGNTGFGFRAANSMMPAQSDDNGSIVAQVSAPFSATIIIFNNTESEQEYTLSLANLPAGSSIDNPIVLDDLGSYTVSEVFDESQGVFYKYVATDDGFISVTMDDDEGWFYSVTNNTTSNASDMHWYDDSTVVYSDNVAVSAGDVVIVNINYYNATSTTINWTLGYIAPVGSADNPETIEIGVGDEKTITVPASGQYFASLSLPQIYKGYILTVTGATGFMLGQGMMPAVSDTNGTIEAQVSAPFTATIGISNTTETEQTYTLTLADLPAGASWDNPEIITEDGTYTTTDVVDEFQGHFYQYIAPANGMVTITMNDFEGWYYNLTNTTQSTGGDMNYWDDDPAVYTYSVLAEKDDVIDIVINFYEDTDSSVSWSIEFVNYVNNEVSLNVGTSEYEISDKYDYTVFILDPSEIGEYTVSLETGKIAIISNNGMWATVIPGTDTVTESSIVWECTSVGQSIWVAVTADAGAITVSREDINIVTTPVENYVNTTTPEDFTFEGNVDDLIVVDIDDEICDVPVLGEDGYYHLNTADGPIIYVNLDDSAMSLYAMSGGGALGGSGIKYTVYGDDNEPIKIINYNNAFNEYFEAADAATCLYPLTADLMEMFKNVGEASGWYGENGWIGGELDDAWMYACYYLPEGSGTTVAVGDVNGNGKVDARDYLLLKRAYFGTYELTCDTAVADINGNGKVDARDYLLLKRAYFGTYVIGE